ALSLFQAGSLSVGSAARIAGMPLPRFLEILASLRIPVADASDADLDDELAQARWGHSPSGTGAASAAGCPPP
ncbi:MAG: hypothetical protein FJ076_12220, partial [Cyanobacteria bacterium K_DeepCast_35m_m1_288]|nr:hypothetical protein [Cyanobacteria bacterium K_DeepCast_35m_m1_288]